MSTQTDGTAVATTTYKIHATTETPHSSSSLYTMSDRSSFLRFSHNNRNTHTHKNSIEKKGVR